MCVVLFCKITPALLNSTHGYVCSPAVRSQNPVPSNRDLTQLIFNFAFIVLTRRMDVVRSNLSNFNQLAYMHSSSFPHTDSLGSSDRTVSAHLGPRPSKQCPVELRSSPNSTRTFLPSLCYAFARIRGQRQWFSPR